MEGNLTATDLSNSSTPTIALGNDFFKEMYSNSNLKTFTIFIFFFGAIFGLLMELGIIWYERNGDHRYRTAINQLFSTNSWLVVSYILLVFIPDGVRYLTGPLNETFCELHNFMKNFVCISILLVLDFIILLRYIFIFKLSNFAVINDDLVAGFLQITILVLSLWIAFVKKLSVGRMPLNYFMCAGKDPSDEGSRNGARKYDTLSIIVIISILLHIFASAKIFLYQRKIEQSTKNIELGQIQNSGNTNQALNSSKKKDQGTITRNMPENMADLTTLFLCLMFSLVLVIVHFIMNQIEPKELNSLENRWLAYYTQIIGVAATILGRCCRYYLKNRSVLRAMWRNVKRH